MTMNSTAHETSAHGTSAHAASARPGPTNASETATELYVTGLKDAHALEKEATQLIQRQIDRIENYPEVTMALETHLRETEMQIERLDMILNDFSETSSSFKDAVTSLMGNVAAIGHATQSDEILKNHLANCAFENMEIASYTSLIAMAEVTGNTAHIPALELTLREERKTSELLHSMTADLTKKFVMLSESEQKADR